MNCKQPWHAPDAAEQHRDWLSLVETTGPFLSLPVLRRAWPSGPDALEKTARERLRREHAVWQDAPAERREHWIGYVCRELLGWGDALATEGLGELAMPVAEHDTTVIPDFALREPDSGTLALLGTVCAGAPNARVAGSEWSATPADRMALACRYHGIELGLVTDGRWWILVWAPRADAELPAVTATATFDAISWPEAAERHVLRAFYSLLCRTRFFGVPEDERLLKLLRDSLDSQEDITEALGVQVRQAVELLVAAIGRSDVAAQGRREPGLVEVSAHEVYRAAVSTMMRVVFLLFAEERDLLPADNDLYASVYSASRLRRELQERADAHGEPVLEHTSVGWHRLLALFTAVHSGVDHPRLHIPAHDGSLFDPQKFGWLPLDVDDRTVLHMLRAVQEVRVGTGKSAETRTLSFAALDVEQIGYVYEGLLSFEGFRADGVVLGLVGKEGAEEEVALTELEHLAAKSDDLPAALADQYESSGIGSAKKLTKALTDVDEREREERRKRLLAVTGKDNALSERLLPFYGILRPDLRSLPMVILPGALYVTESALRRNTGTHYTPRFLAEQVVEGALEPLVYQPVPLETAERSEWQPKSSQEILALKVADIAMGSAAFLVAAARYLADRLVEAWTREGTAAEGEEAVLEARRQVIEHCLYGVDINPMAVEMAKLSLWLVSMDAQRPFTFLDDRLVAGDSLLGITSLQQVEYLHMDPAAGRKIHERGLVDFLENVRSVVSEVAEERKKLAEIDGSTVDGLARKRELLAETEQRTSRAKLLADLAVGATLAHAGRGERGLRDGSIAAADYARRLDSAEDEARAQADSWLRTDKVPGSFDRQPLHWPMAFPEVFEQGGFDAVVGNPPFLGGTKITKPLGVVYREYLVESIANGFRSGGRCDLIAYFVLRVHSLLGERGQAGLIATNTLAQGDTREVGLDRIVKFSTIRRSLKSQKWPSKSAALEYCAIWTSLAPLGHNVYCIADGVRAPAITPSLEVMSRVDGVPEPLAENRKVASKGSDLIGTGFTLDPELAHRIIVEHSDHAQVVRPYLTGQDLNSRPDCSASRWVVDFRERSEWEARKWAFAWEWIEKRVKPERIEKDGNKYPRMVNEWWKHWNTREQLYERLAELDQAVVIARVSKTAVPAIVPTGQVFSEMVVVFCTDDAAMLASLSSASHYWWAVNRASSMRNDLRYSSSDVFETFPLPKLTPEMRALGERLDSRRREIMLARNSGLTKTYNLVFDPSVTDPDIAELREIHKSIDEATVRAYGWEDLLDQLDHGFHPAGAYTRYTIGPAAQREMLDRLLELNHARYADEVARGLHAKNKKKSTRSPGDQGSLL
jgi:hypothetical protein